MKITGNEPAMPTIIHTENEKQREELIAAGYTRIGPYEFFYPGLSIRQQAIKDFAAALIIANPEQIHNSKEGLAVAEEWAEKFIEKLNL